MSLSAPAMVIAEGFLCCGDKWIMTRAGDKTVESASIDGIRIVKKVHQVNVTKI